MIQCWTHIVERHGGRTNGQTTAHGRTLGIHPTSTANSTAPAQGRTATGGRSQGPNRYPVRSQNRNSLGRPASRNGLRIRDDLLASPARLATGRGVDSLTPGLVEPTPGRRPDRLVAGSSRQCLGSGGFWGAKIGPNPTDRRKYGSKHHTLTDAQGLPLAVRLTGANCHDVTPLLPLVDAIPPVKGKRGRPRQRPDLLYGDRAYDSHAHRMALWARGIAPALAWRNMAHGSGLGQYRWVVERTPSWLHQFRRLRIRYERRADIHEAFLSVACSVICLRILLNGFC